MTEKIRLENDLFLREIVVGPEGVYTSSIFNKVTGREYNQRQENSEFQFSVNDDQFVSYSKPEIHILDGSKVEVPQMLQYTGYEFTGSQKNSRILKISMHCGKYNFALRVCYEIYSDLPGCAKWLEIDCLGEEIHLHRMFFEQISACPGKFSDSDFYTRQGQVSAAPMFASCGEDDIIQLHNSELDEGFYLGNSACGPLRYFMVYPHWGTGISCGYSMSGADFNTFLKRGDKFVSDKASLCLYQGEKENPVGANLFREMVRRDLPECPDNGKVMYCTWLPFLKDINESLLLELVDRASALGFYHFVVDDGWFVDGDWKVDPEKFPDGLEVIADKVHAAGMKFGLWLNIGNDYGQQGSRKEDNATDFHNEVKGFGFSTRGLKTRCFASKHRDLIGDKLIELAGRYGVDYFKLDFSNILSPYGMMSYGCHSCGHEYHRDYSDSVYEQYQSMLVMRNNIKKSFPELMIDFSFEVFGTERPSIAALRYSELHHASNMNTLRSEFMCADRLRRTLYEYGRLLPNERLLGSLICLQNNSDVEHMLTAFAGTPLVAGDLRTISDENLEKLRSIVSKLNSIVEESPMTEYELLNVKKAGERKKWDGFARYSVKGNGIICLFRNDYDGTKVKFALKSLPEREYILKDLVDGQDIMKCTADELRAGITIEWPSDSTYIGILLV